jgi:trehalose 6-phosphate phosphatase
LIDDLEAIVARIGDLRRRIIILDFDGTLSPIVDRPDDARLAAGAEEAVDRLLDSPAGVVVLSGRHLDDLAPRLGRLAVTLVGGHGAAARQADGSRTSVVDIGEIEPVLREARSAIDQALDGADGWMVEEKPHSVAVHYRNAAPDNVDRIHAAVLEALEPLTDRPPGWSLLDGKAVVELRPRAVNKGEAVRWIAARHPGRVPLVIGDDVTDEEAFAAARELGGDGVLVNPSPRPTKARWRLDGPDRVVEVLRRMTETASAPAPPTEPVEHAIEDHGLITDSRTAALVSPDGSVDWLCVPRFDSPSVFGAILDPIRGGRFRIRPRGHEDLVAQRTYLGESNVLVTRFVRDGEPILTLTDLLVYSRVNAFDPTHTGHILLRRIEAFARVDAEVEFQPRFDYGRAETNITRTDSGLRADAGTEYLELESPALAWEISAHEDRNGAVARGHLPLEPGDDAWFVLRTAGAERSPHRHLQPRELLELTVRTWGRWSRLIQYSGPWREQVVRSALLLKGLVYEPTGALVAAPTTSLPETVGGERNWDYRYAWIRDSAYVLECFLRIGHSREAETFIRWLSELSDHIGGAHELRPLYRITGEEDLSEFELPALAGYRGSRPVRVGNAAATQLQLDIYGAAMQLGYLTELLGGEVPSARWPVINQLVETVAERWREPDSGLWEIRAAPRHHTFSKFQCWLAVDRAVRIGRDLGLPGPYERWEGLAREIADDILARGYDDDLGTFVQAYDSPALDASVLLLPLKGLLPPGDRRIRSTAEAVRRELEVADGLLLRYRTPDGLEGEEGAFLMCSFWLVEVLARMGDLGEAERVFERLLGLAGPLGLYAEQIDPRTHAHLGNYPQAFTHMGLIAAATAIAEERDGRPT